MRHERTGPAVERRRDLGVLQIEGWPDRPAPCPLRVSPGGRPRWRRSFRIRARQNSLVEKILCTLPLGSCIAELRVVFGDDRFGLTQRRLERPAIEHEKRLTLADVLSRRKQDLLKLPGGLRADVDRWKWLRPCPRRRASRASSSPRPRR